ncbi:transcriptional regulator [Ancylobacter defluvii]|nr:transcriptional regulator [Ancylobacter defluvii]
MKARTMRIARGEERLAADDRKVWFTSTESFVLVLSSGNRELLRAIDEQAPAMASYGLVSMEPGKGRKLMPKVLHDRVALELPLLERREAKGGRP